MACYTLLTYPYFNKIFKIHTDASNFQLGAFISHRGTPTNPHIIKLTDSQKRYIVTDKDLLITVEILKEFITILIGQRSRTYTDNKNHTCKNFNTDRVLIWRLIIIEYSKEIEYIRSCG